MATGERKRLTAPAEFAGETTPRFSPDGKSLAFVRVFSDKRQDLFVVPTDGGGEARQITSDGTIIHSLAWSADAQDIFFVSFRGGSQASLWLISAAGGEPQAVATRGKEITNLAASPDGKTLAFVENNINTDIWRTTANQPPKRVAASTYNENNASFSPDGSRLVFTSNRTGKTAIWLANADGKNLRQLTESSFNVKSPRFSPDGSQVVYEGLTDENSDIFTVSAEGGAARRLTENAAQDFKPSWSANGKWIYFTSNRTGADQIWKMPASGGDAVQITKQGGYEAFAAPDGKTIFYRKADNKKEIWRVPADGDAEENLPEFARDGFTGSWTMTRTGIYFLVRISDEFLKIEFYDFADGKIKDVSGDDKIPDKVFDNLDATDDGGGFLYSLLDQNAANIMLAELGN